MPDEPSDAPVTIELPQARMADLPQRLKDGAAQANWTELTAVQARAIPYIFASQDTMIQSRTGSGKTGAYLLPMLELLNPREVNTQSLVLVPTRELALQVEHEARTIFAGSALRIAVLYGGVGYRDQLAALSQGSQLVVGTPGRILDHLMRKTLKLDNLRVLIFDEADRMLSMGFYPDMRRVQSYLPGHKVSTYMFSATYPAEVIRLSDQFMQSPGFLNLSSDHVHVSEVQHVYYSVPGMDKDRSLIRIIEMENPSSALIFCNTKVRVEYVTTVLQRFGYDADDITSNLSQSSRENVMTRVRAGSLRFLIATDVAARGIDLPDLSHVIQYEPPEDIESYIHRAGRTGRAGASGTAITLVNTLEKAAIVRIAKAYQIDFQEMQLPDDEQVAQITGERVISLLENRLRGRDKLQTERMQRFLRLAGELAQSEDERPLLAMLLDDFYQANFHPPVSAEMTAPTPNRRPHPHHGAGEKPGRSHNRKRPGG
jgi:ATP-dependent RNA helicase DeaD